MRLVDRRDYCEVVPTRSQGAVLHWKRDGSHAITVSRGRVFLVPAQGLSGLSVVVTMFDATHMRRPFCCDMRQTKIVSREKATHRLTDAQGEIGFRGGMCDG